MSKPTNLKPFQPGQTGNPGGRPRLPDDVKQLARSYTREAIETAAEIMRDPEQPGPARMSAVNTILDRGWGKAPQHISVDNMEHLTDADLGAELAEAADIVRRFRRAGAGADADDGGETPPTAH